MSIDDRPQWRVIEGGSRRYVEKLTAPFADRIRLSCPVHWIRRIPTHVQIKFGDDEVRCFDEVVVAVHSDQALRMLADPSRQEREILGAIPYQKNDVLLHTDTRVLPRRRLARAAWNYRVPAAPQQRVAVTYDMNLLQGLEAEETFCVTLNHRSSIAAEKILGRFTYHHPVFTPQSVATQARCHEISGRNNTWYCGAYWGYGFHEDGVASALAVARALGRQRLAA